MIRECVQELKDKLPERYDDAWNHPNSQMRERWKEAIRKELHSLIHVRKVWRKIKKKSIPGGHCCVKLKGSLM